MAWYNIFREKKRAFVVFLSLFMGIITFLSVNTFLSSVSVDNYIDRHVKNDFEIENMVEKGNKLVCADPQCGFVKERQKL